MVVDVDGLDRRADRHGHVEQDQLHAAREPTAGDAGERAVVLLAQRLAVAHEHRDDPRLRPRAVGVAGVLREGRLVGGEHLVVHAADAVGQLVEQARQPGGVVHV